MAVKKQTKHHSHTTTTKSHAHQLIHYAKVITSCERVGMDVIKLTERTICYIRIIKSTKLVSYGFMRNGSKVLMTLTQRSSTAEGSTSQSLTEAANKVSL